MKEKISYYKGWNPLIALPAFAACAAYLVLAIIFLSVGDILLYIFHLLPLCVAPIFFIICKPGVAYASKLWVRGIVSLAIVLGVGTFLVITSPIKNPEFKTVVDSLLLAISVFSLVLLLAHIAVSRFNETASKLKPERSSPRVIAPFTLQALYGALVLFLRHHQKVGAETGEASFALLTMSGIAFLWFEEDNSSIAERETIPLCAASLLWMLSALIANYAYASLASVTFVLPYLLYLLPLILLGIYYYVSSPEED